MNSPITAQRKETKYIIDRSKAHELRKVLQEHIEAHCFRKGKILTLISTIYFDTPDFSYFKQAVQNPLDNVKIRAREYYYFNRELVEHAASMDSLFEYSDHLWLEIKQRKGESSLKNRIRVRKSLLNGSARDHFLSEVQKENQGVDLNPFENLLVQMGDGDLVAMAVVNYQRNAFQNADSSLRISMDHNVRFHPAPGNFFELRKPMTRENLPPFSGEVQGVIFECKYLGGFPDWLAQPLESFKPTSFSKFTGCMGSVSQEIV